jgi:ferredoxin
MPAELGFFQKLFGAKAAPHPHAAPTPDAHVTPDPTRCVQCGVCGYNCPVGIPVREYARLGRMVDDLRCVQCGQCIEVCPRGTLRWVSPGAAVLAGDEQAEYAELMRLFPGVGESTP